MRFTVFILLLFLCACAGKPPGTERVSFATASPRWLDEVGGLTLKQVKGRGYLILPQQKGPEPVPAVILLHSSLGVGSLEWDFAKRILAQGQAVLLVDSFKGRGIDKITDDQMAVSEVSILNDLYAAQRYLLRWPEIDGDRIAVAGLSKGALPALYSAFPSIHRRYGYQNDPFRSHLAFYPWCGLTLKDLRLSGSARADSLRRGGRDYARRLVRDACAEGEGRPPEGTDQSLRLSGAGARVHASGAARSQPSGRVSVSPRLPDRGAGGRAVCRAFFRAGAVGAQSLRSHRRVQR
jgi:hypothetical protein